MRIVIAAVSSNHCMSGVSRHAANLAKCLLARPEVSALHVLVAAWEHQYVEEAIARNDPRLHIHAVSLQPGTLHRNLWYYRALPAIAEQLHADLVHIAYPSPIQHGAFACPVVLTLHDLYPYDIPSNFGFPKVLFNRIILRQCLRNSSAIACVSESTRALLTKRMPEVAAKAVTVLNCVESGPVPHMPSFAATWRSEPFLLCVAQHRRNKNIPIVLRAFKRLITSGSVAGATRLVVIGMPGPESRRLYALTRALRLEDRVLFVSGISDAEISWCYRNCELLVAPSSIEGFGLPIVEARLAGCRIVCADIPAFREVGGDSCIFVPLTPRADEAFAEAAIASLRHRRALPARTQQFSPAVIAEQVIALYRTMLPVAATSRRTRSARISGAIEAKHPVADEVPTSARF